MQTIQIRDEFIKLGQALKLSGLADTGAEAKNAIQNGEVRVNGQVETQRGKKLVPGDVVDVVHNLGVASKVARLVPLGVSKG